MATGASVHTSDGPLGPFFACKLLRFWGFIGVPRATHSMWLVVCGPASVRCAPCAARSAACQLVFVGAVLLVSAEGDIAQVHATANSGNLSERPHWESWEPQCKKPWEPYHRKLMCVVVCH